MTEDYKVRRSETPEITILIEKDCETIDNCEQTEIANEVEIETIDVPKVDNEITITIEPNNEDIDSMPIIISDSRIDDDDDDEDDDELDKACQTMQDKQQEIILNDDNDYEVFKLTEISPSNDVSIDRIYTLSKTEKDNAPSSSDDNLLSENSKSVTLLEIDDMNFMISNDFIQAGKTVLSKVEDYECIKEANDGSKIIMNIGEEKVDMQDKKEFGDDILDENILNSNLNIHADERMPPRGELSEQESNGASDIHSWGRVYQEQECSSGKLSATVIKLFHRKFNYRFYLTFQGCRCRTIYWQERAGKHLTVRIRKCRRYKAAYLHQICI